MAFALRPIDCKWRTQSEAHSVVSESGSCSFNEAAPFCNLPSLACGAFRGHGGQAAQLPTLGRIQPWRAGVDDTAHHSGHTWGVHLAALTSGPDALAPPPPACSQDELCWAPPHVVRQIKWELDNSQVWLPRSPMAPHQDMCTSIAWDWLYLGCTPSGCLEEAQTAITAATLNALYKRNNITVTSAAIRGMALAALAAAPWNLRSKYQHALREVVAAASSLAQQHDAAPALQSLQQAVATAVQQHDQEPPPETIFGNSRFGEHFSSVLRAATATAAFQQHIQLHAPNTHLDATQVHIRTSDMSEAAAAHVQMAVPASHQLANVQFLLASLPVSLPGLQLGTGVRWWEWAAGVSMALGNMVDHLDTHSIRGDAQRLLDSVAAMPRPGKAPKGPLTKEDKFANFLLVARKRQQALRCDLQQRLSSRTALHLAANQSVQAARRAVATEAPHALRVRTTHDTAQECASRHVVLTTEPSPLPSIDSITQRRGHQSGLLPQAAVQAPPPASAAAPPARIMTTIAADSVPLSRHVSASLPGSLFSSESTSSGSRDAAASRPGQATSAAPIGTILLHGTPASVISVKIDGAADSRSRLEHGWAGLSGTPDGAPLLSGAHSSDDARPPPPTPPSPTGSVSGRLQYEVELARWEAHHGTPQRQAHSSRRRRSSEAKRPRYADSTGSPGLLQEAQVLGSISQEQPLPSTTQGLSPKSSDVRSRNKALSAPRPTAAAAATHVPRSALASGATRGKRTRTQISGQHLLEAGRAATDTAEPPTDPATGAKRPRRRAAQTAVEGFKRVLSGKPNAKHQGEQQTQQTVDELGGEAGRAAAGKRRRGRPYAVSKGAVPAPPESAPLAATPRSSKKSTLQRPHFQHIFQRSWSDDEYAAELRGLGDFSEKPLQGLSLAIWPAAHPPQPTAVATPMHVTDPTDHISIDSAAVEARAVHSAAAPGPPPAQHSIPLAVVDLERNRHAVEHFSEISGYEPAQDFKLPFLSFDEQPDLSGSVHMHLKGVCSGSAPESDRRQAASLLQAARVETIVDSHIGEDLDAVGVDGYYCVTCRAEIAGAYVACVGCFAKRGVQHNMCLHCFKAKQTLHISAQKIPPRLLGKPPQMCPSCDASVVPLPAAPGLSRASQKQQSAVEEASNLRGQTSTEHLAQDASTVQPSAASPRAASLAKVAVSSGHCCKICLSSEHGGCVCHCVPALHFRFDAPSQKSVFSKKLVAAAQWQILPTASHFTYASQSQRLGQNFRSERDQQVLHAAVRSPGMMYGHSPGIKCDTTLKIQWLRALMQPSVAAHEASAQGLAGVSRITSNHTMPYKSSKSERYQKYTSLWGQVWHTLDDLNRAFAGAAMLVVSHLSATAAHRAIAVQDGSSIARDALSTSHTMRQWHTANRQCLSLPRVQKSAATQSDAPVLTQQKPAPVRIIPDPLPVVTAQGVQCTAQQPVLVSAVVPVANVPPEVQAPPTPTSVQENMCIAHQSTPAAGAVLQSSELSPDPICTRIEPALGAGSAKSGRPPQTAMYMSDSLTGNDSSTESGNESCRSYPGRPVLLFPTGNQAEQLVGSGSRRLRVFNSGSRFSTEAEVDAHVGNCASDAVQMSLPCDPKARGPRQMASRRASLYGGQELPVPPAPSTSQADSDISEVASCRSSDTPELHVPSASALPSGLRATTVYAAANEADTMAGTARILSSISTPPHQVLTDQREELVEPALGAAYGVRSRGGE